MKRENIKTVLLGYDRKTVDMFLKKLHRLQEEELEDLRQRLGKAGKERKSLLKELRLLEEAANRIEEATEGGNSRKAIDFYDAAARRARKLAVQKEPYRPPVVVTEHARDEENPEIVEAAETIDNATLATISRTKDNLAAPPSVETNREERPTTVERKAVGEYRWLPKEPIKKLTVRGAGFWDEIETYIEPMEGELLLPEDDETPAAAAPPLEIEFFSERPKEAKLPSAQTGNEDLLEPDVGRQEAEAKPEPQASPAALSGGEMAASTEFPAQPAEVRQATTFGTNPQAEPPMAPSTEPPAVHPAAGRPSSPELDALKRHYIVGKVAGEDLYDRQGRVIVSKQSVITEQILQAAEREGMLVELIVNMIIPGLED